MFHANRSLLYVDTQELTLLHAHYSHPLAWGTSLRKYYSTFKTVPHSLPKVTQKSLLESLMQIAPTRGLMTWDIFPSAIWHVVRLWAVHPPSSISPYQLIVITAEAKASANNRSRSGRVRMLNWNQAFVHSFARLTLPTGQLDYRRTLFGSLTIESQENWMRSEMARILPPTPRRSRHSTLPTFH